jgi:hypothetical protein
MKSWLRRSPHPRCQLRKSRRSSHCIGSAISIALRYRPIRPRRMGRAKRNPSTPFTRNIATHADAAIRKQPGGSSSSLTRYSCRWVSLCSIHPACSSNPPSAAPAQARRRTTPRPPARECRAAAATPPHPVRVAAADGSAATLPAPGQTPRRAAPRGVRAKCRRPATWPAGVLAPNRSAARSAGPMPGVHLRGEVMGA